LTVDETVAGEQGIRNVDGDGPVPRGSTGLLLRREGEERGPVPRGQHAPATSTRLMACRGGYVLWRTHPGKKLLTKLLISDGGALCAPREIKSGWTRLKKSVRVVEWKVFAWL
jgi:hypothetical protein